MGIKGRITEGTDGQISLMRMKKSSLALLDGDGAKVACCKIKDVNNNVLGIFLKLYHDD